MYRKFRWMYCAAAVAVCLCAAARGEETVRVVSDLNQPPQNQLNIKVTASIFSDQKPTTIGGNLLNDLKVDFDPLSQQVTAVNQIGFVRRDAAPNGTNVTLSDVTLNLVLVTVNSHNVSMTLDTPGGFAPVSNFQFDLAPHNAVVDHGTIVAAGLINQTIDLAAAPITQALVGTGTLAVSTPAITGWQASYNVTSTVPVNFSQLVYDNPATTIEVTGTIVTHGQFARTLPGTTLTWDGDLAQAGLQEGGGTWDTTTAQWFDTGTGVYHDWRNTGVDSASFGVGGSGAYTIQLATDITAAGIAFRSGATYTLTGSTLTIGAGGITTGQDATIESAIAGTNGLTKSGAGTLTLTGPLLYSGDTTVNGGALLLGALDGSGNTTVNDGLHLTVGRIRQNQLSIGNGALATVRATADPNQSESTNRLGLLSIAGGATPTGTLDLNNSSLIIDYAGSLGTTLSDVTAQIKSGRNGKDSNDQANWNGKGIITTAGRAANVAATVDFYNLGAINNADLDLAGIGHAVTTFAGQAVSPGTVLVKFTYSGDANLDGKVDGDDYSYWLNGFLNTTDPSIQGWLRGDFDYNGVVDGDDYTQWLNSFLHAGPPLSAGSPAPVPEPATVVMLSVVAAAACIYARRRKR